MPVAIDAMQSFQHDGVDIAFLDEGDGEPVFLVHGFASTAAVNWVHPGWVATLSRAGRRAIATLAELAPPDAEALATALVKKTEDTWGPVLLVERVDGQPARSTALGRAMIAAGFRPSGPEGVLFVASFASRDAQAELDVEDHVADDP